MARRPGSRQARARSDAPRPRSGGQAAAGTEGGREMKRWIVVAALAVASVGAAGTALATSSASELPPNWHIHDGQIALGPQHKGIGFFPTILGVSTATYL